MDIETLNEQIKDLKRDLNNELNKSCKSCTKMKECKILHYVFKYRLEKQGHLMYENEFSCKFWECSF